MNTEILISAAKELITPYIEDISLRSIQGGYLCSYNGDNGKHCAFAMAVKPEMREHLEEGSIIEALGMGGKVNRIENNTLPKDVINKWLRPQFQAISNLNFWLYVQKVHDHNRTSNLMQRDLDALIDKINNGDFE